MSDGFVRSVRFFINNMLANLSGFLAFPIIICFYKWFGNADDILCSAFILMVTVFAFAMAAQHYSFLYKTAKIFSVTGKNFLAACHVNKLVISIIFTATAWLTRYLINFYEFTPRMLGIVFLASVFFGFVGEFCGILLCKCSFKLGIALFAVFTSICMFYVFFFAFVIFGSSASKINMSTDSFLLISALIFPVLSVIFFVINSLAVKNLEIRS